MHLSPVSTRQPSLSSLGPLAKEDLFKVASYAYEATGLCCADGPLALMNRLSIEWDEARADRRPREEYVLFDSDLPRYERNLYLYRRIAEILLWRSQGPLTGASVDVVQEALIAPFDSAELEEDEIETLNPHVAPELVREIVTRRGGPGLLPIAG